MRKAYVTLSVILLLTFLLGAFSVFSDDEVGEATPTPTITPTAEPTEVVKKNPITSLKHIKSALMIDAETGTVVYSFANYVKTYPAVTAKMMVALVVLDEMGDRLDEEVKAPGNVASIQRGAHIELVGGEIMKARDLLTAIVMNNANDAAYTLAFHISGSIEDFVELMNQKAALLGMTNTKYVNVTDADETGAYTTANDVMILARELYGNKTYTEMAGLATYTVDKTNKKNQRKIYTRNYLLSKLIYPDYYMKEATGLCAGSSIMGGYCAVASAIIEDKEYICVILDAEANSTDGFFNFIAAKEILFWAADKKYTTKVLLDSTKILGEIKVRLAEEYDWVGVVPKGEISMLMPQNVNVEEVTEYRTEIYYNVLTAPVTEGEDVGVVRVYYEGVCVGSLPLVTRRGLGQSKSEKIILRVSVFLTSKQVITTLVVCGAILVIGVIGRAAWLYRKRISIQVEYEDEYL